jgi:NitT/TauT family transport system permease protein
MNTLDLVTPNASLPHNVRRVILWSEVALLGLLWVASPFRFLPRPIEVFRALADMWMNYGLGSELIISLMLNIEALAVAAVMTLVLAYLATVGIFRPPVRLFGKLRFLSLIGLTFFFTLAVSSGHQLKLSLEVFSVSVFYVTGMEDVIAGIPKEKYDLARTLRMGPWRVLWEVVVLGQADKAFDVLRQNAAMGWMMLSMIESFDRSEGGVGALLVTQNRHFYLAAVFAIQLCILGLGILQDYAIAGMRKLCCPYADLAMEKR